MITVSNTTAITTLLKVGREDLLTGLFGAVWIPSAVEQELLRFHASIPPGCVVHSVPDSDRLRRLLTQADRGEAEAICLAVEAGADLLLIDDKKGARGNQGSPVRPFVNLVCLVVNRFELHGSRSIPNRFHCARITR